MNKLNKKILIIEDDNDFLAILQKKFTDEGFSVIIAQDGEQGLELAKNEKPDLILSDILIPKVDGITMAKELKKSNTNIPIIFLTNVKDNEYSKESNEFDVLIKSELRLDDIIIKSKNKLGLK